MPDVPFGIVAPRDWSHQRVFIVGGGSSLAPHRAGLRSIHERGLVLAINDSWRDCRPTAVFSVDHVWTKRNQNAIPSIYAPVTVALERDHPRPPVANLTYVLRRPRGQIPELSTDPGQVTNLLNSGASGIDYAALRGAREIFLLGFDFMPGPGKETHYHTGYEWHSVPNTGRMYPRWAALLDSFKPALDRAGIRVYNCSPKTLLTAFPYRAYEEFL